MSGNNSDRAFRFSVNMFSVGSRAEWQAKCQRTEALGYDVVMLPDHLGMPAPFPALVAAADATERFRVGTFVLNSAFFNPVLLAREVATVDQLTDGRLELGLGTGYVRTEFETAGLPWTSAGTRVDHLARTVDELSSRLADPEFQPATVQPGGVPLLIAGNGDRVLRLAAEKASIVGFAGASGATSADKPFGLIGPDAFAERVKYVRTAAGSRADELEFNVIVHVLAVADGKDGKAGAIDELHSSFGGSLSVEEFLDLPSVLIGTPERIAEHLKDQRERLGITHYTVMESSLEPFAKVIEHLR
jgi:probable F420-dependent oxidoreductase